MDAHLLLPGVRKWEEQSRVLEVFSSGGIQNSGLSVDSDLNGH